MALDAQGLLAAFYTNDSLERVAKKFRTSPNTLRPLWRDTFGADALKLRGERLRLEGNKAYGARTRGVPKTKNYEEYACSGCGAPVTLTRLQKSRIKTIICAACTGKTTPCPVCSFLCKDSQGLGHHLGHKAKDAKHAAYLQTESNRRWEGLEEGLDYVVCKVCDFKGKHLFGHIRTHGHTAESYRAKYPSAPMTGRASTQVRAATTQTWHKRVGNKGLTKEAVCPCGVQFKVGLTASPGLCPACKEAKEAKEARYAQESWAGLEEGLDYVVCKVCGVRARNLTSHIQNAHADINYREAYPLSAIWASNLSYGWTPEALKPFMDNKGRVVVTAVCAAFDCAPDTVIKFCRKNGLTTKNKLAWQKLVLDRASQFLDADYEWEWTDARIVNPETGRRLRYDGFFPSKGILIEAHGDQHFGVIAYYQDTPENFFQRRLMDSLKEKRATECGYSFYVVRKSDPIHKDEFWADLFRQGSAKKTQPDPLQVLRELRLCGWPETQPVPRGVAKRSLGYLESLASSVDAEQTIQPYSFQGIETCSSFFPNRYEAKVSGAPSVREAWNLDKNLLRAIKLQLDSGHPTTPERVRKALVFFCRCPSVFRPAVATYIYQTYCPTGGSVWDPCAGYGGRLLGAMSAGVGKYIATDVEPATVKGNRELALALNCEDRCEVYEARAEDFDDFSSALDLVFTSPPYFDLETYGEASRAVYQEYLDVNGWVSKFLDPVIAKAFAKLKPGGHLVLNVPQKPLRGIRLDLAAEASARGHGFAHVTTVYLPLRSKVASGKKEPILIWQKPSA